MVRKIKLFITDNVQLFPAIMGGRIRINNLYRYLPDNFEITYLGVNFDETYTLKNRIIETSIKASENKFIYDIMLKYLFFKPYLKGISHYDVGIKYFLNLNFNFKKELKINATKSDILISSHPWFFSFLAKFKNKILIYDAHNCEYELLKKRLLKFFNGKIYLYLVYKIEKEACKKSDLIIACSEKDKNQLSELYNVSKEKIIILPNTVNTELVKPINKIEKKLLKNKMNMNGIQIIFIGTNFFPNNYAVDFIIDELANSLPEFNFIIVGSVQEYISKTRKKIPNNVKVTGLIPQEMLSDLLKVSDIAINPITEGSGICIKNLDFMSSGLPLITTQIGIRGIPAKNMEHAIICNREEFADKVKELIDNKKLILKLSKNARELIKSEFDAKKISYKLAIELEKLVKKNRK